MHYADLGHIKLHYLETGSPDGPPLVFANSLGTDLGSNPPAFAKITAYYKI